MSMNNEIFTTRTFHKNEIEYYFVINKSTGVTVCNMKDAAYNYDKDNMPLSSERMIAILEKLKYVFDTGNDIRTATEYICAPDLMIKAISICAPEDEFDVETGCANAFMKAFREYQSYRCQDIQNLIYFKEREINALKEIRKSYHKEFKNIQQSVENKKYKPYKLTTSVKNLFSGIIEKFKKKASH